MKPGWIIVGLAGAAGLTYFLYTRKTAAPGATIPGSSDSSALIPATGGNATATEDVRKALEFHALGQQHAGQHWATQAKADGATTAQIAQLTAAGYSV